MTSLQARHLPESGITRFKCTIAMVLLHWQNGALEHSPVREKMGVRDARDILSLSSALMSLSRETAGVSIERGRVSRERATSVSRERFFFCLFLSRFLPSVSIYRGESVYLSKISVFLSKVLNVQTDPHNIRSSSHTAQLRQRPSPVSFQ